MNIHPTAIIDPSSLIHPSAKIGPYTVIGPRVEIGADTEIIGQVSIDKDTKIGEKCRIFPFASIGADPQDLKYQGESTRLEIGNNVTIRESVTIHRGTEGGGGLSKIGNNCLIMATCHIAHDCILGDDVILSSYAVLAGHIHVGLGAIIGGLSAIHQFTRIGEHAFLGGASSISKDLPPYIAAAGMRDVTLTGPNVVGLRRRGFSEESIKNLMGAFKIICRNHRPLTGVLEEAEQKYADSPEVLNLVNFYRSSERGVFR